MKELALFNVLDFEVYENLGMKKFVNYPQAKDLWVVHLNVRNSICSNNLKKFLNNKFSATHIKSVRVIGNDGNFKDFNLDGVVYEVRKIKSKAEDERREKVRNAINSFK